MNHFIGEPPWQPQLREMMERTSTWQSVNQNPVSRIQENLARHAGVGSVATQITELQKKWQKQWQLNSPALDAVSRYHEDMARQVGIGVQALVGATG